MIDLELFILEKVTFITSAKMTEGTEFRVFR